MHLFLRRDLPSHRVLGFGPERAARRDGFLIPGRLDSRLAVPPRYIQSKINIRSLTVGGEFRGTFACVLRRVCRGSFASIAEAAVSPNRSTWIKTCLKSRSNVSWGRIGCWRDTSRRCRIKATTSSSRSSAHQSSWCGEPMARSTPCTTFVATAVPKFARQHPGGRHYCAAAITDGRIGSTASLLHGGTCQTALKRAITRCAGVGSRSSRG